jgi:hypothetical protein
MMIPVQYQVSSSGIIPIPNGSRRRETQQSSSSSRKEEE